MLGLAAVVPVARYHRVIEEEFSLRVVNAFFYGFLCIPTLLYRFLTMPILGADRLLLLYGRILFFQRILDF